MMHKITFQNSSPQGFSASEYENDNIKVFKKARGDKTVINTILLLFFRGWYDTINDFKYGLGLVLIQWKWRY